MQYTLVHIGINCKNEDQARKAAGIAGLLFGWEVTNRPASVYADSAMEFMKTTGYGAMGHIGIGTTDVVAAVEDLKSRGFSIRPGTEKYNQDGTLRLVYLQEEICGFALHLVKTED